MKRLIALFISGLFTFAPLPAADRVALVVGCANYTADPALKLDTPINDMNDVASALESPTLGFQVIRVSDATRVKFDGGLRQFRTAAQGARVALVYFSGHGIEHDGKNYLVTVNATLESEDELDSQTMPLAKVMSDLGQTGATVKLAVMDCCRNNPFATKSWVQTKDFVRDNVLRALGEAEIPQATLVCFATGAGRKAAALLDDRSIRSPFTDSLIKELVIPGQSLRTIFENVHDQIKEATSGRQVPTVQADNALSEVFRRTVLVPGSAPAAPVLVPAPTAIPASPAAAVAAASSVLPNSAMDLESTEFMQKFKQETSSIFDKGSIPNPGTTSHTYSTVPLTDPEAASVAAPFVNSISMKFVPVQTYATDGRKVLFSVYETRFQDYFVFYTKSMKGNHSANMKLTRDWMSMEWDGQRVGFGIDQPAVGVSHADATAFCAWLTESERAAKRIGPKDEYRLPTDIEWSFAIDIGAKEDPRTTPDARDGGMKGMYPWGTLFPPPNNVGNYPDETAMAKGIKTYGFVQGYTDGYVTTAPVGKYQPNRWGLYDMGGNVWEWCQDWANETKETRVIRGSSWNFMAPSGLLSSTRFRKDPGAREADVGFRCVLYVAGK